MKMGGSKGGFIPLLQAQRSSKLLFLCTVCYACLGKLRGLYDSDFGKNTILEKHKFEKLSYLKSLNLKFLDKINS